jgi:hypothetical protein
MRVVKPNTKEGHYGDVSVYRCIGDLGIFVFHRPGRDCRPEASSLTRVRDGSIPSGHQVVEKSQARAALWYGDSEDYDLTNIRWFAQNPVPSCTNAQTLDSTHCIPVRPRTRPQPSAGIVFRF